jgi:hypothetical protein
MNQRILVDTSNWARHVARRLLEHWREKAIWRFSDPPFLVAKDEDAAVVYSQLPSLARWGFQSEIQGLGRRGRVGGVLCTRSCPPWRGGVFP